MNPMPPLNTMPPHQPQLQQPAHQQPTRPATWGAPQPQAQRQPAPKPAPQPQPQAAQQQQPPKQQIDFNKAIQFVNKIKALFPEDTDVYKKFLEILQTYSKESRTNNFGIKEVYEQVAQLFKDQPDLLDEFTHFLPDQTGTVTMPGLKPKSKPKAKRASAAQKRKEAAAAAAKEVLPPLNPEELEFFHTIKSELQNEDLYQEILKCLHLYTNELITREEMLTVLEELFGEFCWVFVYLLYCCVVVGVLYPFLPESRLIVLVHG